MLLDIIFELLFYRSKRVNAIRFRKIKTGKVDRNNIIGEFLNRSERHIEILIPSGEVEINKNPIEWNIDTKGENSIILKFDEIDKKSIKTLKQDVLIKYQKLTLKPNELRLINIILISNQNSKKSLNFELGIRIKKYNSKIRILKVKC